MRALDLDGLRSGEGDCPSDYALDLLHTQELDATQSEVLRSHMDACPRCSARMRERQAGFLGLGEQDPEGLWEAIRAAKRPASAAVVKLPRQARGAAFGGLLAIAAALVLVWLPTRQRHTDASDQAAALGREDAPVALDTVRAKGTFALRVHLKRPNGSEEASSGDRFEPGDTLRFAVFLPSAGHVRVLGQEADGTLYTAWPLSPTQPSWFDTAGEMLLPGAVRLDASAGRETLYALLCPQPLQNSQCTPAGADAPPRCPAECDVASFILNKGVR